MEYGIMFFSSSAANAGKENYRLLLDAARFADERGFAFVSTPERHFHPFGGIFPNPAITSAALATITERVQIRAGSLISPLHHPIRMVEEWAVVDNLSGGRAAISFGSGWNVNDFVFFPERYTDRREVMVEQIEEIRLLWRGEPVRATNSLGKPVELSPWPKPVQAELPVWLTSSGNEKTFIQAGRMGANVLTHLIGQDLETLARKVGLYREALDQHGRPGGKVTLMLHTHLGSDVAAVKDRVREPFQKYLRSAVSLEIQAAAAGGAISGGHRIEPHAIGERDMDDLLALTFERYFTHGALMGTPESCRPLVTKLRELGVDEIACLIDFLDDPPAVLDALEYLDALRAQTSDEALRKQTDEAVGAFMEEL